MKVNSSIWPKVITVDKSLIKTLSQSTYDSFPNALRELITNSYDALATEVRIDVDVENEKITIWDNGSGMSEVDYEFYLRIAGTKREVEEFTRIKREKIGKFGVGFLAVFPFFRDYKIESKKSGMTDVLFAHIPCHLYFDMSNQFVNISDIKIDGGTRLGEFSNSEHFTKITLNGFTSIAKEFLFPGRKIYKGRYSITNPEHYDSLDKLKWVLSEDLPLKFKTPFFQKHFFDENNSLPFSVFFNTKELLREIYAEDQILELNIEPFKQIGNIKLKYAIVTDMKPIRPTEGRYLKIRNLNVGVGERISFVGTARQGGYPRLQQLTGEVHILEGMNDLLQVTRDKFNYSTDYEELKSFFATRMIYHSAQLQKNNDLEKAKDPKKIRSLRNIKPVEKEQERKSIRTMLPISNIDTTEKQTSQNPQTYGADSAIWENEPKDNTSTLEVMGRFFVVKSDEWDYNSDDFPACKLSSDSILVINTRYPLFKGVKHTDVFVKLHLFLLLNFKDGIIGWESYKLMAQQVLSFYENY